MTQKRRKHTEKRDAKYNQDLLVVKSFMKSSEGAGHVKASHFKKSQTKRVIKFDFKKKVVESDDESGGEGAPEEQVK